MDRCSGTSLLIGEAKARAHIRRSLPARARAPSVSPATIWRAFFRNHKSASHDLLCPASCTFVTLSDPWRQRDFQRLTWSGHYLDAHCSDWLDVCGRDDVPDRELIRGRGDDIRVLWRGAGRDNLVLVRLRQAAGTGTCRAGDGRKPDWVNRSGRTSGVRRRGGIAAGSSTSRSTRTRTNRGTSRAANPAFSDSARDAATAIHPTLATDARRAPVDRITIDASTVSAVTTASTVKNRASVWPRLTLTRSAMPFDQSRRRAGKNKNDCGPRPYTTGHR
ncbi:MAG: hypothetical protein JWR22_3927 [Herminiimonas sp.]|nr:hypothetical protein [Herminiimonas sp.]